MGTAILIALLLIVVFSAIAQSSEENSGIKKATQNLPPGSAVVFGQRVTGKSRKGVVTYYSHFACARCKMTDGSIIEKSFQFNHHDSKSKVQAWDIAHKWVIENHK